MPETRHRVVCTFGVTIATFWPTRLFRRVDLPVFEGPSRAAKPQEVGESGSEGLEVR